VQSFLKTLQGYGVARLAALAGAAFGVIAVVLALMFKVGGEPQSLLYANLDPKEAAQVTSTLDQAGIKYEVKGDGTTITVPRDKVASTRLLVAGKGLVTSGSVGYEIFDTAPALGQTDFVQHLNQQRALEGELARTIRAIQGVSEARVLLNMPKKQLFEDDADAQASASIMVTSGARRLSPEQVSAIRNLVAGAVPNMKPERVTVADQSGALLAGSGDSASVATGQKTEAEERIRKTVMNIVEGVVGPGHARVQVSADVDMARVTTSEEKFDPDGQVVRSTQTSGEKNDESKPSTAGGVSASQNIPGAASTSATGNDSSKSDKTDETTNYEISKTTRTEVTEPGRVKRLSVAVAVDGITAPGAKGKPGPYSPRSADEMKRIESLVRTAMGFDQTRGDQVSVVNVRFDQPDAEAGGAQASGLGLDKNDIMRGAELAVMLAVAVMLILFVLRPMLKPGAGGSGFAAGPAMAQAAARLQGQGGSAGQVGQDQTAGLLPGPTPGLEDKIDIARIEGQVKATSVRKVAEFVEKHPEESVSILRGWLHETG
jgi:flagellar M-ring protein FliF